VAHEVSLPYARWAAIRCRPGGMGAFHDFAASVARARTEQQRSSRASAQAPRAAPPSDAERAVERWDGEGGNTQTRVARRGRRA
jgi:hypothetical protein